MKFVSTHLTKHHLLHAPHRWFLAFLLSPIHALEVHYQRQYHLQFSHARKLFIFDMLLLASIFVIGGAAATWYFYDPTVTKLVNLEITASPLDQTNRVKSGELIAVKINYQNHSHQVLRDAVVHVNLPKGFLIRTAPTNFVTNTGSVIVADMKPREGGELLFSGQYVGEPGKNFPADVELVYRQETTDRFEVKTAGLLTTPADSVLIVAANFPATIYSRGQWEVPVTITNTGNEIISGIAVPFPLVPGLNFSWLETGVAQKPFTIQTLNPNQTATGTLRFVSQLPTDVSEITVNVVPTIAVNNELFAQAPLSKKITVLHPGVQVTSNWGTALAQPGEKIQLQLKVTNSGSTDLRDVSLVLPLSSAVNARETATANKLTLKGSTITISAREIPGLAFIPKQESREIPLTIVISNRPTGGAEFSVPITVNATVPDNAEKFESTHTTPAVKLGTFIALDAEARYYSYEGDQIGRGPLPPKVGKETKYWALLSLTNGAATADNVTVSAILAPGVVWTGKTSVTRGREPLYNPSTRTVSWTLSSLSPNETAGINFELSFTPTEAQRGTLPLLLTGVRASATDSVTQKSLSAFASTVTTGLNNDELAQERGVRVE